MKERGFSGRGGGRFPPYQTDIRAKDTINKITELSNAGFEEYNEADGYQFFRIMK